MAFSFSLQSVLRFRQGTERERLLLLQAANLRVAEVRSQIEALGRDRADLAAATARKLSAGVHAAQLHFNDFCRSASEQRQEKLQEELLQCEATRLIRSQEFQQARQQREILERLRDQQFDLYHRQQERQNQRQLDDILLLHRAFLRHG
jgi:flagellar export protein FliJ